MVATASRISPQNCKTDTFKELQRNGTENKVESGDCAVPIIYAGKKVEVTLNDANLCTNFIVNSGKCSKRFYNTYPVDCIFGHVIANYHTSKDIEGVWKTEIKRGESWLQNEKSKLNIMSKLGVDKIVTSLGITEALTQQSHKQNNKKKKKKNEYGNNREP